MHVHIKYSMCNYDTIPQPEGKKVFEKKVGINMQKFNLVK